MDWLSNHFSNLSLDSRHKGYFLGRGAKESTLERLGVKTWVPLAEDCPDSTFSHRYRPRGSYLDGWAVWPVITPRGNIVGFEGRAIPEKRVEKFQTENAQWNPLWTGMSPVDMEKIWGGCDVWVVEGIFDLFAMEWAVPSTDVVLASRTAKLSYNQVEFLRRFCSGWVKVVFDNDSAGRHGVEGYVDDKGFSRRGAISLLERVGVNAIAVPYVGKDPGEIWDGGGSAAMVAAFKSM